MGLVDKIVFYIAPILAGSDALSAVESLDVEWVHDGIRLRDMVAEPCGPDIRIEAYVEGHG
jgi:diaminohydroxyphosphoribosylaminopyrimidine deaminase/5-amino-6-(5-phosphoribosylamino)uracil reductase